jgi:hypothetical protein
MSVNCLDVCANAKGCAGVVSSNGHTTWATQLPEEGDWNVICGNDMDNISAPYVTTDGGYFCNGWVRACQCGSGEAATNCGANNQYCG